MKTKICLFNDREKPMICRVQGIDKDPEDYVVVFIPPNRFDNIEFEIPEGAIPFIKIWDDNSVLVSHIPQKAEVEGV